MSMGLRASFDEVGSKTWAAGPCTSPRRAPEGEVGSRLRDPGEGSLTMGAPQSPHPEWARQARRCDWHERKLHRIGSEHSKAFL
jgi:hypothetical protein